MESLVFKLKDVEGDHMVVFNALKEQRCKNEDLTMELWSQLMHDAYLPLVKGYIESDKIDEISDYVLEQWDNGTHGFELFELISNALVSKHDTENLIKFWKSIVLSRHQMDHQHAVAEALRLMRHALQALGDETVVDELEAKLKQRKLSKKNNTKKQPSTPMTENEFWKIVERAQENGTQTYAATILRADNLESLLLNLAPSEVQQFAEIFRQKMNDSYSWDLWAIAYIAFGGCGDDNFDYFRAWLISEGKETYEQLTRDPETITNLRRKPFQLESILYIPSKVYTEMTGQDLSLATPLLNQPSGIEWDESEEALRQRFPKAFTFYNN